MLKVSLEVSLNDTFADDLAAVGGFADQGVEKSLSELVSALTDLDCDYGHYNY